MSGVGEIAQARVAGGDDAHVRGDLADGTDWANAALLDRAQQARLQAEWHGADLVQEQRAAFRVAEHAGVVARRAGECARSVPKELALDDLGRQRGAIQRHERLIATIAQRVDGAREDLLAGAGFAGDEHRRLMIRELPHAIGDRAHHRARADHTGHWSFGARCRVGETIHARGSLTALQRAPDRGAQVRK